MSEKVSFWLIVLSLAVMVLVLLLNYWHPVPYDEVYLQPDVVMPETDSSSDLMPFVLWILIFIVLASLWRIGSIMTDRS